MIQYLVLIVSILVGGCSIYIPVVLLCGVISPYFCIFGLCCSLCFIIIENWSLVKDLNEKIVLHDKEKLEFTSEKNLLDANLKFLSNAYETSRIRAHFHDPKLQKLTTLKCEICQRKFNNLCDK
jgi:hypothetical protein